ncbi:MAG: DNA helicase II, partial [Cellvibrionaceae bacterium]|nr:DNA helicase II [Cellvibrionaceae bacterium]
AGVEEGLFPHRMSAEEPGRLEEERRLCYVGITRAMQKLYICYAESRRMYGSETFNQLSRFVKEIPDDLIEEVRLKTSISRPISYGSNYGEAAQSRARLGKTAGRLSDDGAGTGLSLGQRVLHPTFGEGTVLHFEGNKIQLKFDDAGTKWLIAGAKLEPLS